MNSQRRSDPRLRRRLALLTSLVVLGLLGGLSAVPAAAATPGCTLDGSGSTVTRSIGDRSYELHVPANLAGTEVPLLLTLHGFGGSGRQDEYFTGWSRHADAHNFIVAYPNGRPGLGFGAWDPYSPSSPDVAFLRRVADDISARWCVDPQRVHVDGWSNGAVMSQRAACEAADRFASVTSYGGGTPTPFDLAALVAPCRPSRPISVGLIVGEFDFTYAGLAQNTREWLDLNSCSRTPLQTTDAFGSSDTYSCAAGTEVLARVLSDTSHEWPSGARGEDQRDRIWAFFGEHP